MKKTIFIFIFLFFNINFAFGSGFYLTTQNTVTFNKGIKIDFNIVYNYLKSGDLRKAVEVYNQVAQEKQEEKKDLIDKISFMILSKIALDKNQHRDLRHEAALILVKWYPKEALSIFKNALEDKNYLTRMRILNALGKLDNKKSFKVIASFINDDIWNVRVAAIEALGETGGGKSASVLKNLLDSDDYFIRLEAALALVKMGRKDGLEIIKKEGIKEKVDRFRKKTVKTLAERKSGYVIGLLKEALKDKNKEIRDIALKGLMDNKSKSINFVFKDLLKMEDKYIKVKAAGFLLSMGERDVIPTLTYFLLDKDEIIKLEAANALLHINEKIARNIMQESLESKNKTIRHLAADYLEEHSPSSFLVTTILKAYRSDDYYVRAKAVKALGKMKSRLYYHELKKAMYDRHSFVRMAASSELALKGEEDGINSIIDFLKWGNDELRMFSMEIIYRVDPQKYLPVIRRIAFAGKSWSVGMKALELTVSIVRSKD